MTDREKLIELLENANYQCENRDCDEDAEGCGYHRYANCWAQFIADHLIANGVTIQSDVIERLSKGMGRLRTMMLGHDKAFDERMAGYDPSAFCVGFDYAMQLAMGLLTQLPEPPKGE